MPSPLVATKLIALPELYIRVVLLVVDGIRSVAPSLILDLTRPGNIESSRPFATSMKSLEMFPRKEQFDRDATGHHRYQTPPDSREF